LPGVAARPPTPEGGRFPVCRKLTSPVRSHVAAWSWFKLCKEIITLSPPPPTAEPDQTAAIRQRAVAGVATTLVRGIGVRGIGLLLNLVLARILVPAQFGQLALGLTIYSAFSAFANAGLGASLVRRPERPGPGEVATVFGAQLTLGLLGVAVVGGLAVALSAPSLTLATLFLMCGPIQAPRTASVIELERRLDYKRLAILDVIDNLCQGILALGLVLAGLGVYGIALAQPLGVAVGTLVLVGWRTVPLRPPRFKPRGARSLLTEGALFGASDVTNVARDMTLNWGTAAIGGLSVLGTWSLTTRLATIPSMAIQAVSQVAYSAVPRLQAAGGSAQDVVIPALRMTSAAMGAPTVLLAGCAPQFVPLVLGARWKDVSVALPLMCFALLIAGPISVASTGFLFARGRVRRILASQVAHSIVAVVVAFTLLPSLGVAALGVAMCAAGLTDAVVLGTATLKGAEAGYLRTTLPLLTCTVLIGIEAFAGARLLNPSWPDLVLLACATTGVYTLALLAVEPADARQLFRLAASTVSRATAPSA
jgi:O-antigen/teichoic acid export membrane protein